MTGSTSTGAVEQNSRLSVSIIISISVALFLFVAEGINYSQLAPFFPNEAELNKVKVGLATISQGVYWILSETLCIYGANASWGQQGSASDHTHSSAHLLYSRTRIRRPEGLQKMVDQRFSDERWVKRKWAWPETNLKSFEINQI